MYDLAHACLSCRTVTIFAKDAAYPRRCGCCDSIVRAAPADPRLIARPVFDGDDDDRFTLELGPMAMQMAPF
jgi:hypothetical protein